MKYKVCITHELVMRKTEIYGIDEAEYCKKDFDSIDDYHIGEFAGKPCIEITGIMHLYGHKVANDDSKYGFYDVINQRYYPYDAIESATITESKDTTYFSPVKPRVLRRKVSID